MKPLSKPFFVAGVQHAKIPATFRLSPTPHVEVRHNPENPYDPYALEVRIDGTFVGHIPRAEQAAWFYQTMHDVRVSLRLIDFDRNRPPYESISVVFECDEKYMTAVTKQGKLS